MGKFDIEPFKKYIHESSAAIFSEESNKKHDWKREITINVEDNEYLLYLRPAECSGNPQQDKFYFFFDLELFKVATKTEAKELLCRFADAMQFHPNIKVLDRTEHSEAIGYPATGKEPTGDDRYFWLRPKGFNFKKDKSGRYCWDEVPEDAYPWFANMVVEVKTTPSPLLPLRFRHRVASDGWGSSFDLNPDPVSLLRAAIRERDEEIARKEAERKAKEETDRLAAEKAEREQQDAYDKLKGFLENIGDFVILDAGGVLTPIKELWIKSDGSKSDGDILLLGNRGRDPFQLSLVDGFDENVKKIISWAVKNGVREPELKTEAA